MTIARTAASRRPVILLGTRDAACAEQGQALAWGLALLAIATAAWAGSATIGRVAGASTRLVHVADAAVYSGALVQARSLNLVAYINRAQIAHQVALAHLATIASWNAFAGTQAQQSRIRNPPATLIGGLFGPSFGWAYGRARGGAVSPEAVRAAATQHDAIVHDVLLQAARLQLRDTPILRDHVMQAVLHANDDSGLPLTFSVLRDGWAGTTIEQGAKASKGLRPLALDAAGRYGLLFPRDRTERSPWIVYKWCPWMRHELRRMGQTTLSRDGRWASEDTQSFHSLRFNKWRGCYHREYPMGWAQLRGAGGDRVMPAVTAENAWRLVEIARHGPITRLLFGNPMAQWRAFAEAWELPGRGLPAIHGLSHEAGPALVIRVQGGVAQSDAARQGHTSASLAWRWLLPLLDSTPLSHTVAAQAYLALPPGRQGLEPTHLSALLRPYWMARRVAVPKGASSDEAARHATQEHL